MYGEAAHAREADSRRVPFPPVTSRWSGLVGEDPGATGRRLPPFFLGVMAAPAAEAASATDPVSLDEVAHEIEPEILVPDALLATEEGQTLEAELVEPAPPQADAEPLPWEMTLEPEPDQQPEPVLPDLDLISDTFTAELPELELEDTTDAEAADDWLLPIGDLLGEAVSSTETVADEEEIREEPVVSAAAAEAITEDATIGAAEEPISPAPPEEQPWEAFGRALQEAISFGDLPADEPERPAAWTPEIAEDEAPAEAWDEELVGIVEPSAEAPTGPHGTAGQAEAGAASQDEFVEEVAEHLQSLVDRLRARGMRAIGDAILEGDKLEASLALFLAGYRAGRGE